MNEVDSIVQEAQAAFARAGSGAELEDAKASFLGKSGRITQLLQGMAALTPEEKKTRGAMINRAKQAIESALQSRREAMAADALEAQLRTEALDVTLPGTRREPGGLHPITLAAERIEAIFRGMGFEVADGPEIESDWYSFTALNNPPNHPARSMQDTFYVDLKGEDGLHHNLRPHTSSMQIRHAQAHATKYAGAARMPDIRVIAPGRVFRVDNDATHSPMFHQVEGLWIGENVSFRDLKAMYLGFVRAFFETDEIDIRFRPSFFPFTEPSAEIDIRFAHGPLSGRWLEVSGSGQVHPDVVRNMGLDPERYIGFAFGTGIDRMAMQLYGVGDLRAFFDGNIRFLQQFR